MSPCPGVVLAQRFADAAAAYYCADDALVAASPLPTAERCVGVRLELATDRAWWAVALFDASAPRILASAPVDGDVVRFHEGSRLEIDGGTPLTEIVFEGYADGVMQFTKRVFGPTGSVTSPHHLGYPAVGGGPVYRIGGFAF